MQCFRGPQFHHWSWATVDNHGFLPQLPILYVHCPQFRIDLSHVELNPSLCQCPLSLVSGHPPSPLRALTKETRSGLLTVGLKEYLPHWGMSLEKLFQLPAPGLSG